MRTPFERLQRRLARKAAARRKPSEQPGSGSVGPPPGRTEERASPGKPPPPPSPAPRLVRRVVWGYQVGMLPVPWLMGFKRLKATLEREGFAIRVELLPLTSVPADADLLFVPDDLAEGARQAAPDAQVIALGSRPEQAVFQVLVEQLRAGTELSVPAQGPVPTASTAAPEEQDTSPPPPTRGTIVRYRGWERID